MSEILRDITAPELHRGLDGVVVDETALSSIDGDAGRLRYRGYDIESLAREASFEEVVYLLWDGELPAGPALVDFDNALRGERSISDGVHRLIADLAALETPPMAAVRTAVSMLSAYDSDQDADPGDMSAARRQGRRILAKLPTVLAAFQRRRAGSRPVAPRDDLDHAANFLYMLSGEEPDRVAADTMDMALTLHADHGLNASTFTTLVIVSTYADVYSGVTGGVGALSGPWHGGANEEVMDVLMAIDRGDDDAVEWVRDALDGGERIPGWGHRVYNVTDPRAALLEERVVALAESTGDSRWREYTTSITAYLVEEAGLPEKGIAPNVDFYSGSVYHQLGVPSDLYTPIFAMSRVAGWVGHILEYQTENRLIRPRGRYVGPDDREFVPLSER